MKHISLATLLLFLICLPSFAESTPHFSGQDYLDLSHDQRADAIVSFIKASAIERLKF